MTYPQKCMSYQKSNIMNVNLWLSNLGHSFHLDFFLFVCLFFFKFFHFWLDNITKKLCIPYRK